MGRLETRRGCELGIEGWICIWASQRGAEASSVSLPFSASAPNLDTHVSLNGGSAIRLCMLSFRVGSKVEI